MGEQFQWSDVEGDLVLAEQRAVAVYENPNGDTVIRQEADRNYSDEDLVIIINRKNLAAFVIALQNHLEAQQQDAV